MVKIEPMNLLAFDTSTDVMSIAVQRGVGAAPGLGGTDGTGAAPQVWLHTGAGGAQASTTLIPAIQQLMQQANLRFDELDAIAFGRGPGSFTGLRTACSVAQGLAFGAGVPVLPVDTLLAVAEEARLARSLRSGGNDFTATSMASGGLGGLGGLSGLGEPDASIAVPGGVPGSFRVLAVLDARMDEVYAASYEFNSGLWNQNQGYSLIRPENLLLEDAWAMAGNAFAAYGGRMPAGHAIRIPAWPTASAMLRLAPALLAAGHAVPADQALPTYIRDKVAKTTQERLLEKAAA